MLDGKGMKKGSNSVKNVDPLKVREAAIFNLNYTLECIDYCIQNGYIYRVSSAIIPYPDFWDWENDKEILALFQKIKELSKRIRLIIHPDQFVVLNSDSEKVIENSMIILKQQSKVAQLAGISELVLHIGKKDGAQKFLETFKKLDSFTKEILVLENCHYYKVMEVVELCEKLNIPMVLDVHHARITGSSPYDIERIKKTWKSKKPLAHISSGKSSEADRSHSDYISEKDRNDFLWLFHDFDVEVEAKKKENALADLTLHLKI
jgi:UV DNA damage endonuclease